MALQPCTRSWAATVWFIALGWFCPMSKAELLIDPLATRTDQKAGQVHRGREAQRSECSGEQPISGKDYGNGPSDHDHDNAPPDHDHDNAPTDHDHDNAPPDHDHDNAPSNHDHGNAPLDHDHDNAPSNQGGRTLTIAALPSVYKEAEGSKWSKWSLP